MDLADVRYITSLEYPQTYPVYDIDYIWYFTSNQSGTFVVRFLHFWTQAYYDFLLIGTGFNATNETSEVYRLDYLFSPNTVSVEGPVMWIRFLANAGVSKHGFFLQIERTSEIGMAKFYAINHLYSLNRSFYG